MATVHNRRRGRTLGAHALAFAITTTVMLGMLVAPALAANITGTWGCCGGGGIAVPQDWHIVDSGGSLSGTATYPSGAEFGTISGSVSGRSVTIVTDYTITTYTATFVGTIGSNGLTMSGTWSDTFGRSDQAWSATTTGFTVSGMLTSRDCGSTACTQSGVPGITVGVNSTDGGGVSTSDKSDSSGNWSVNVPAGTYSVTPQGDGWNPTSRNETVQAPVSGVDFTKCASTGSQARADALSLRAPFAPAADAAKDCTTTTLTRCLSATQPTPAACVVTVQDIGHAPTTPTGLVTTDVTAVSPPGIPLPITPYCTLIPNPGSIDKSTCTLNFNTGSADLARPVSYAMVATYNGDDGHSQSRSQPGSFTLKPPVPPPDWSSKAGKDILSKSGDYLAAAVFGVKFAPDAAKIPGVAGVPEALSKGLAGKVLGVAAVSLTGAAVLDKYVAPNYVDPFDPHYAVVAAARTRRVFAVPAGVPDRATLQSDVDAMERQFALTTALETTENRATSAKRAGNKHAYRLQEQAISLYLGELADAINRQIASQTAIQHELDKLLRAADVSPVLHPHIPAASLGSYHAAEAFGSLTREETRVLSELGVSRAAIDKFIETEVTAPIPATIDLRTLIANGPMLQADRKEARMFRAEARVVPR